MNSKALDQFFTKDEVALRLTKKVVDVVGLSVGYTEPSAGGGAFCRAVASLGGQIAAFDIDPKLPYIQHANYLETAVNTDVILGNPPFGKNSSLAVKFFNKAAKESSYIAFILPRTFEKEFFQNKLDRNMWLIHQEVLDENSFTFEGKDYSVPCVFQIWQKRNLKRPLVKVGREFVRVVDKVDAEYAIRRVGGRSGEVLVGLDHADASVYYVRDVVGRARQLIQSHFKDLNVLAGRTAGMKSITIKEINYFLEQL